MVRQAKSFLILMDNYDRALQATEMGYNSAGSAAKEFAKWQDSIEGRTNNLKSSLEQLSTKTLNSDFIKSVVDSTTATINFTTACGGAIPVVLALGASFAILKLGGIAGTITAITGALTGLTTLAGGLSLATLGWAIAIPAAILGIGAGINAMSEKANRAKEVISTLSSELEDLKSKSSSVESLGKTYISLKGIDDKTTDQLNEYYDVQNKLHELMPEINGRIDEQGNFIIDEATSLQDLNSIQREYIRLKREELALASKENMKNVLNSLEDEKSKLNTIGRNSDRRQISKDSEQVEKELKSTADKIKQYTNDMSDSILQVATSTQSWSSLTEDEANAVRKAYASLSDDKKQEYAKQIEDDTFNTQQFINTLQKEKVAKDYLTEATNRVTVANKELASSYLSVEDGIKKLGSVSSEAEKVNSILKSLNKGDELSANDIETLLGISDEYLVYLGDETKLREKLTQSMSKYKEEYQDTYNQMLGTSAEYYQTKIKDDDNLRNQLESNIKAHFKTLSLEYNGDLKRYTDLENAKAETTVDIVKQVAGVWAKFFSANGNLIKGIKPFENTDKKLDPFINDRFVDEQNKKANDELIELQSQVWTAQAEYDKVMKEITYTPVSMDFDKSSSDSKSASKAAEKELSEIEKLYEVFQKRIKDKEFEISLLDFNGGEDTTSKQIAIYKQMQDETHALAEKARELDLVGNAEYIQNLQTQWIEYTNKILDLSSETYNKANKKIADSTVQIELKQQLVGEDSQEYFDLEKEKYDNIIAQETLLQNEIARLQAIGTNEAKKQAESLIETYYDTVEQRYSIIKNMQSSQVADYNKQIESLEKQKSAIESLHDFTMQMIRDEMEEKKKSYQDEIDGINKVFEAKKKSLQDSENQRDYNNGLSEKSSVIADLENQLAIIKNDETAIAKRKELEKSLTDARKDLAEYQHDHEIELATNALDEQQKIETDAIEKKIDKLDETLSNEVKMRELADSRINKSGEKLYKELISYAKEYGSITEDEIKNAWDNANISLLGYKDTQEEVLDKLKKVTSELNKIKDLNIKDYSDKIGTNTGINTSAETTKAKMMANSAKWVGADATTKDKLARDNQDLGNSMGWTYDPVKGRWFYDKDKKLPVYHEGGIVGGLKYATKDTEELAKVLKGELYITPPQASKVMDMITNNNSEQFNPTFVFQFEGEASESLLQQFKNHSKYIAGIVADEFDKSRSNSGYKKKFKTT